MSQRSLVNKNLRFTLSPGQKEISNRAYNLILGATLLYGFIVNAVMISYFGDMIAGINYIALLVGYFVCVLIGVFLTRSENPVMSFIGYNFIVVPLGAMLSVLLPYYQSETVFDAVLITGAITLIMMVAGTIFPKIFLGMGRALFFTLLAVILVEMVSVFLFHKDFAIIDYVVVILFSGYIGYDWARANTYRKTVDNAIDCAADLYMDIINIFIRVLAILNRD